MNALERIAARFPDGTEVRHVRGWSGVVTCASSADSLAQGHIADVAGPIVHVCWALDNGHIASQWFRPYVLSTDQDETAAPAKARREKAGRKHG